MTDNRDIKIDCSNRTDESPPRENSDILLLSNSKKIVEKDDGDI